MDSANPDAGCVYRGDLICSVAGVDKALTTDAAFKIHGMFTEQDSLEYINVGRVLVRSSSRNGPWQAGRIHIDGVHWEERTWAQDEFVAFRDHVASLVEVKLSPREELEQMIANTGVAIRNCRRLQARHDRDSQEYAEFEGMIEAGHEFAASFRKKLEALQSSSPDMASAAR